MGVRGVHQLGDPAAADGDDGVQLLHHDDVVKALGAGFTPTHVLQRAGHILLSIQIVGQIAFITKCIQRKLQHPGDFLPVGDAHPLFHEGGALFQCQGVDGDVLRVHFQNPLQRGTEALVGVLGQAGDEVHIDAVKANLPGQGVGPADVVGGVAAADGPQDGVVQGLGVDGDAADVVAFEDLQLFPGDGVGPAGLHGVLGAVLQRQRLLAPGQNGVHLLRAQSGGGAATHVEGAHRQSGFLQGGGGGVDLGEHGLHIGIEEFKGLMHVGRDEGAVSAPGGTEGHAHVDGHLVGAQAAVGGQTGTGAVHGQLGPDGGHVVVLHQLGPGLVGGAAPLHGLGGQLHRPYPGQRPPGGLDAQDLLARGVEGHLDGVLQDVVDLLRSAV